MIRILQLLLLRIVFPLLLFATLGAKSFQGGSRCVSSSRQSVAIRPRCQIPTTTKSVWNENNCNQKNRFVTFTIVSHSSYYSSLSANQENADHSSEEEFTQQSTLQKLEQLASAFTLWTPLWTILASGAAVWKAPLCSNTLGSLKVLQTSYWALMMTMGLAITENDVQNLQQMSPRILLWNAILCFGGMPLLAMGISRICQLSTPHTTGLILLGCVGGGQASNLFALLAGGNVALSVVCTISTTLLGVLATPLLLDKLLGYALMGSTLGATLKSIASLVLVPLLVGGTISKSFPKTIQTLSKFLPVVGISATLLLVAGGSSNSYLATQAAAVAASSISWSTMAGVLWPSCGLGILGGILALGVAHILKLDVPQKKTLVVETLSKSPTLAYLLALKHFGIQSALVPGGAMVTLAVLGALVASVWSKLDADGSSSSSIVGTI